MGVYKQLFDTYSKYYDTSGEAFTTLKKQLSRQSDNRLIDRKNFLGHFTASTFVVSKSTYHVALVHHNFLGKYLQPGGHIDESDNSPLDAAQRELQEETGINSDSYFTNVLICTTSASRLTLVCNIYPKTQRSLKEMDDFTDIAKKIEALAATPFITKV